MNGYGGTLSRTCILMKYENASAKNKRLICEIFNNQLLSDDDNNSNQNDIKFSKNMILYGPPGTGKTYNSIIYAVAICSNRSVNQVIKDAKNNYDTIKKEYNDFYQKGQIAFTTFHQSYSYEDFIEGIKPIIDEEDKNIIYDVKDGIFKLFCDRASQSIITDEESVETEEINRKNFAEAWNKLVDEIEANENQQYTITIGKKNTSYDLKLNQRKDGLKNEWVKGVNNYITSKSIYNKWKNPDDNYISNNGFVRNVATAVLEDLIHKFKLPKYIESKNKKDNKYVFIIDEINRGNISKIFGELITLIEENKRKGESESLTLMLPSSSENKIREFEVPNNVYIIGTMNTADRSIALMDIALRRRFKFIEMSPNYEHLKEITVNKTKIDLVKMLYAINSRIEALYDREHTIGHSFFIKLSEKKDVPLSELKDIFEKNIIPLLQEYFYDDYGKIKLILNNDFIIEEEINEQLFNQDLLNELDIDIESLTRKKYRLDKDALNDVNNYIKIYSGVN